MNLNYTSNTTVQRNTALNPLAPLATILSQIGYSQDMGPVSLQIGGERRQYPGRPQVDENYPSINITSKPINVTSWLLWTPSFTFSASQSLHIDSQGDFAYRYHTLSDGTHRQREGRPQHAQHAAMAFSTPFKIGDFQVTARLRAGDTEANYPQLRTILDPVDTAARTHARVPAHVPRRRSTSTSAWRCRSSSRASGTSRRTSRSRTSIPASYFVRSERTGLGRGCRRASASRTASAISPTFYGLFDGFGPVAKWRHSITPSLSFSYAPAAAVSAQYLAGHRALAQRLPRRARAEAGDALAHDEHRGQAASRAATPTSRTRRARRKIKVLTLTFTPLTWDFERAQETHKSGFTTDMFGYTLRSDLLPGFDFGSDYSLFQGSVAQRLGQVQRRT